MAVNSTSRSSTSSRVALTTEPTLGSAYQVGLTIFSATRSRKAPNSFSRDLLMMTLRDLSTNGFPAKGAYAPCLTKILKWALAW